jgi:hypothetical protein
VLRRLPWSDDELLGGLGGLRDADLADVVQAESPTADKDGIPLPPVLGNAFLNPGRVLVERQRITGVLVFCLPGVTMT